MDPNYTDGKYRGEHDKIKIKMMNLILYAVFK